MEKQDLEKQNSAEKSAGLSRCRAERLFASMMSDCMARGAEAGMRLHFRARGKGKDGRRRLGTAVCPYRPEERARRRTGSGGLP